MMLQEHHKQFAVKSYAKFMTGTRRTEVPLIRGLRWFLLTYYDK